MMQRFISSHQVRSAALWNATRLFSAVSYSSPANPRVWLSLQKDGADAGRLTFELYANHSPNLAANFLSFCGGGSRSYAGTSITKGAPGFGVQGGDLDGENGGAGGGRLPDENLELRHHKRGILSMINDGPHANGSEFLVTFGEANSLNGYRNVVGELVDGEDALAALEADCHRASGKVAGDW